METVRFDELDLCQEILRGVKEMGFEEASPIQAQAIPVAMQGYDVEMIKIATELVNVPVIASGGAGSYEDMYQAIMQGGASAVAAASIYHFTEQTPREAKEYLGERGIPVRIK